MGYVELLEDAGVVVDGDAVGEADGEEQGVLDLVPDVGRGEVVEQSFEVVVDLDVVVRLLLVLALHEVLLQVLERERVREQDQLPLVQVPRALAAVHEDRRRDRGVEDLRRVVLRVLDEDAQQQVELHSLVVVRRRRKPQCLTISHALLTEKNACPSISSILLTPLRPTSTR